MKVTLSFKFIASFFSILVLLCQTCPASESDEQLAKNKTLEIQRLVRMQPVYTQGWVEHLSQIRKKAFDFEEGRALSKTVQDDLINAIGDLDVKIWKLSHPPNKEAKCFETAAHSSWGNVYDRVSYKTIASVFRSSDDLYYISTSEGVCPIDASSVTSLPRVIHLTCGSSQFDFLFKELKYFGKHLDINPEKEELQSNGSAPIRMVQSPTEVTPERPGKISSLINIAIKSKISQTKFYQGQSERPVVCTRPPRLESKFECPYPDVKLEKIECQGKAREHDYDSCRFQGQFQSQMAEYAFDDLKKSVELCKKWVDASNLDEVERLGAKPSPRKENGRN